VFGAGGDVSLKRICVVAGGPASTFYNHFHSMWDLLSAPIEELQRLAEEATGVIAAIPIPGDREDMVHWLNKHDSVWMRPRRRACRRAAGVEFAL
jgi:hypothetical protein